MTRNLKERAVRFLRFTERYTKTDMVYFMKGNFWLNVNRASSVLNGLVLSVAFAHLLTKEEYGTYAFALAFIGIFSMPQTTGLGAGITKGVARGDHAIAFVGLKKIFPWSLAGATLLGISAIYYFINGNAGLAACFFIAAFVLPISVTNGLAKSFLSVKGDFEFLARFNLIRTPIMTIVLLMAAWLTQSATIIVIANILGNVLLGTLMFRALKARYDLSISSDETEGFASRYAFHSGVLSIFGYLSEKLDNLLLWKFAGAAPVAIYSYALTPVRELRGLFENQSALALPKYAQKEFHEVRATVGFRIKQLSLLALPIVIAYVLGAPLLFKLLFPQYMDGVLISQLAAISLLASPRRLLSAAIQAHQKIKESYIMIVLPNVVRILLALALIPMFDLKGAVGAFLIAEAIDYAILGFLLRFGHKQDIKS